MASVVDELVVRLGLDSKEFQKGAKETEGQLNKVKGAAATTSKNLQEHGKKGAEFFTQLQKSAIKFFGVMAVGTAASRGFANLIASGAHLSRLATNLGTTANSLHKWGQAVKQSGGTAQGFEATIRGLSAEITAWKTGGTAGPMLQGLQALGVSLVDTGGKAKSLETLLLDMGEAVQRRAPNRSDQANLLAQWGLDEGTINLVLKRRKDAEALISSQPGMDDKAAKKAQDINEKWEALLERVRGKVRELAVQHFPTIERAVIAIADGFERMAPVVTSIVEGFNSLNKLTDGWLGNILMALGALKLVSGLLPGAGAAAAGGIGAGGAVAAGAAGYAGYKAGGFLYDKTLAGTSAGDFIGKNVARVMAFFGSKDAQEALASDATSKRIMGGQEVRGKVTLNQAIGKKSSLDASTLSKIAAAEKAAGLPSGIIESIIKQETGGNKAFLDDPSKAHYPSGYTKDGVKSGAFGPFGLLESTASKPGYGVSPLKDKSFDEQLRFMSQYLAARIGNAGTVFKGLSGYGEGSRYASQVLGRLPGGGMSGLSNAVASTSSSTQNVTIGKIEVVTQATDAQGVARALPDALTRTFNYGTR